MTTTNLAPITSLGIGSGLDLNSIVTQLVALERRPLTQMQAQANTMQTKVSSFGQISSLFSSLQDASTALTGTDLWKQAAVNSSDSGSVTVSGGAGAPAGTYAVSVQSLASSQTLSSTAVYGAATDTVGSGTLTIQLGSWDGAQSAFTAQSGSSAITVNVAAGDSLQTVADNINAQKAGVTAALVTDASGVRLSLTSSATGAANGFKVDASDDGSVTTGAGLGALAYDPEAGSGTMQFVQASGNASATVNGIAVTSASNTLSGVVSGVQLTLQKVTTSPVNVSVAPDSSGVGNAIKTFVNAYNALNNYLSAQTAYNATTKVGGPLQGDSAATSLEQRLASVLGATSSASGTYTRLSDLGLETQRDGTISINQTKLTSALANLPELKTAFATNDGSNAANNGFGTRFLNLADQALGSGGLLGTRTTTLQKMISQNSDDQNALNDRVDNFQTRLIAQYTAMDTKVAQLKSVSDYVTQQLALMNGTSTTK